MPETDLLLRPSDSKPDAPDNPDRARTLPSNLEAEAAFLGAVLIDNKVIEELQTAIQPGHFHEPVHQRIYERVLKLIERNSIATPVTLKPYFEQDEALKALGGITYLAKLTADGQGLLAPRELAGQIYDLALLRELVSVGRTLVENALDTSDEVAPMDQIAKAEASLFQVAEGATSGTQAEDFRSASIAALKMAEAAMNSGGGLSGKTTGLEVIDDKTAGLHGSDLIILAGRPGMGKTSLATNIAFNCAEAHMEWQRDGGTFNYGAPTAFFSLEMSADQLATRILAEQAEITSEALRSGKITRDEFQKLSFASQRLAELPLYIDDTPALTIAALRTRARRLKRRHDIGLIVVDYLQLLQGSGRANDNRVNEISEISRGLKTLAKELNVPVIALSQLSRAVEQREDKRPMLSDLRESGSIEQDADMVWFIYRGDYYHEALRPDMPGPESSPDVMEKYRIWEERYLELRNKATLIVAKQRHGSTGNVPLHFHSEITKFTSPAKRDYSDWGEG
ncbi:replicative DNA helicase [Erythrobacter sp. HI0063]|jgi:replicative DNA helicase|uniref:replicative DNA helicase n=1 Tax=unclassified Erythrobacter TaxID=2633097 RepID=UPI0007C34DA7|nr:MULTISPECIES: replicative DNA helicase [unclassified Erythrobacter]KZY57607.1 replicative DNA helicase [Erythrobacter sp. HI0063]MBO9512255.1 replicative DNA helicase [Erythrobacter sp. A6_0]